jgi:hypothetical protein
MIEELKRILSSTQSEVNNTKFHLENLATTLKKEISELGESLRLRVDKLSVATDEKVSAVA